MLSFKSIIIYDQYYSLAIKTNIIEELISIRNHIDLSLHDRNDIEGLLSTSRDVHGGDYLRACR